MGNVASAAASSGHSGGPPAAGSLSEAAANGDVAAVTAILAGAGKGDAAAKLVNAADGDGWTSVHFASYGGSAPALSLLLAAGGDPGKQDRGGRAPLSLAALRGNLACAAALLKSAGGSGDSAKKGSGGSSSGASLLSARDAHGMQATHKAAVAGQASMLELLLKLGADPDAAASDGSTPAHMAAYKGHVDALRTLLVAGPGKTKVGNALARRKDGLSVLAEAAAQGQEGAVSFLLSLPGVPASVAETDRSGTTAMDLAAARGHSRVVAELRRAAGLPPADSSSSSSALAPAAPAAAAGGGAYPSLYQGGGGAASASAAPVAEQPAPAAAQQQSWWQQAVSAATGATAAAAPTAAAVDPQAASDWWTQAIGREPSELPPPPAAAVVVAEKSESGSGSKKEGGGLLDDRRAFEAAALAKAQGIYRALAGKKNKAAAAAGAAGAGGAPSASASGAAAAVSSSKHPAAREEKYDLEPYDSDDYEEEAPASADAEGERPLPARTARERAAITSRLAQLELAADAAHGWSRGGSKADGSKAARDARAALARQEKEIAFLRQQLAAAASGARPAMPLPAALLDARTPLEFVCPITRQVMREPVVAADGASYERSAITAYLQAGNTASPVTGQRLAHPGLTPNAALAAAISKFMNSQQPRSFGGLGSLSLKRRQQQAPAYA